MGTLIKILLILTPIIYGAYYFTNAENTENIKKLAEDFKKETFKKSPLSDKDENQSTSKTLSISEAKDSDKEKVSDEDNNAKDDRTSSRSDTVQNDALGEMNGDMDILALDEEVEETVHKNDNILSEETTKKDSTDKVDAVSTKDEIITPAPEKTNNTKTENTASKEKTPPSPAILPIEETNNNTQTTKNEKQNAPTEKDNDFDILDPSSPQKNNSEDSIDQNNPRIFEELVEGELNDNSQTPQISSSKQFDDLGISKDNIATKAPEPLIEGLSDDETISKNNQQLNNPLVVQNNNTQPTNKNLNNIPPEISDKIDVPEALYLPTRRQNSDDYLGIKPNQPSQNQQMMDMSEATASINKNANYPNQVIECQKIIADYQRRMNNNQQQANANWNNNNQAQNNSYPQNNNQNSNPNWSSQQNNGNGNCNMNHNHNMPQQQSNNAMTNNGWNSNMGQRQNNNQPLPTSGKQPKLLSGDYENISPKEKIAMTPFEEIPAGTGTCEFEHFIDADNRTETFRMTMLGSDNSMPFKLETKRPLDLAKYLTMHIDEIDGYPDEFSSMSVFCKNMRIKKTLVENF